MKKRQSRKDYTYWKCKLFGHKDDIQIRVCGAITNGVVQLEFIEICKRKRCGRTKEIIKGTARYKTSKELHEAVKSGEDITIKLKNKKG